MQRGDERQTAWRMVAIAFLAHNCAYGLIIGTFAPVFSVLQSELGIGRAKASSLLALMYVSVALVAPLVGQVLQRYSIRSVMITGATLISVGHVLLASIGNFLIVACLYGLLIGPGACLLSPVPATTLVSRWFVQGRGKALGIATTSVFLLLAPPLAALIVQHGGPRLVFLLVAAVFALLIIPISRIVEAPLARLDAAPFPVANHDMQRARSGHSVRQLLGDGRFWLVSVGMGVLTSTSGIIVAHAVSIGGEKGLSLNQAATLVSIFGAGAIVGSPAFGWLADRIGSLQSLTLNACSQAALWLAMVWTTSLPGLLALSGLLGVCTGGAVVLHAAALSSLFGRDSYSRAMGFSYLLKAPFLLTAAPLAGYAFDISGSYTLAFLSSSGVLVIATAAFLALTRWSVTVTASEQGL
jgi:MFS family permease